ncbi:hypothetical protein B0A50_05895 [Salinomyces thailandicus]|uniref:tRNA 4-demethylwyosine synthase (AdoMet-dependent) n=1 Tax=Salinomyces thailandicus TaxID=706561 RepID=A0A4U0TSU5_9PEZI|nr:hypothetical protein B0A50_05895 [Salinomyces thailandica]
MDTTSSLFQLPDELLYLWHAYRTEVLLSAGLVFAVVRLALYWRGGSRKNKEILTPPVLTPVDEKPLVIQSAKESLQDADHYEAPIPSAKPARPKPGPKRVTGVKKAKRPADPDATLDGIQPILFYYTVGGSTQAYAKTLAESLSATTTPTILPPQLHDLAETDYDDFFLGTPKQPGTIPFYLLLLPTYNIDTNLDSFLEHLRETHHDFRIDTAPLAGLAGYSVFGFGDQTEWPSEAEGFCTQAVEADKWMARLTGRKRAFPLGFGDVSAKKGVEERLREWTEGVTAIMKDLAAGKGLGEGVPGSGDAVESGDEEDEEDVDDEQPKRTTTKRSKTADLEDMKAPIAVDFTPSQPAPPKPMVPKTSPTYTALTKQGYSIIGTHSGVKTCRWTKSALRGRGSCYKHSFYGIASHLCMEATPSLSCSNKCVFCWRHGTNPVGTTWRWTVDPPDEIYAGITAAHYAKIKTLRGVPGVRADRFAAALRIRHCALSLVGEPIFYPHINALLALLHADHISTFLVCNAQHPDHLAALGPVTQLYVSIDASNAESLRQIDRPLHRDYWDRFLRCMDVLYAKRHTTRTVFRLTLVKNFNIAEEAEGYANLVLRARPAFIEVKGVTYCGTSTSKGAGLSMANVPFWHEVQLFAAELQRALKARGLDYGVGAEHAHSCCLLLAERERFFRVPAAGSSTDGKVGAKQWHTQIDYAQFFRCLESGRPFAPEDYVGTPTPEWALEGKGGFDPRDVRVDRKGRAIEIAGKEES